MAVASQRIKFLDQQTNVSVSDFSTPKGTDILNLPSPDVVDVTNQLNALVDGNREKEVKEILKKVGKSPSLEKKRVTKDFYSTITDIKNAPQKYADGIAEKMFPSNSTVMNAFNQVGSGCKRKILSGLSQCRNKHNTAGFDGKLFKTSNRSCSAGSFTNLINKITNGVYKAALIDQCALSKMVYTVASRGFEIGLPKVFTALSGQIQSTGLLAQTGAMVLASAAKDKNINAVIDVANSRVGKYMKALSPNASKDISKNYKTPPEVTARNKGAFYTEFNQAMTTIDPTWKDDKMRGQNVPSVAKMDPTNKDLTNLFEVAVTNKGVDLRSDGTVPAVTKDEFILAGLKMGPKNPEMQLKKDLGLGTFIPVKKSESVRLKFSEPIRA